MQALRLRWSKATIEQNLTGAIHQSAIFAIEFGTAEHQNWEKSLSKLPAKIMNYIYIQAFPSFSHSSTQ